MYNFVDVNETSEAVILPSEALCLNGEYIENLIPGYRTLTVEGREALSPELEFFSVGSSDGATHKSKRYPERIITITYQLISKTSEDFRQAYNQLGKILDVENAQLIFNDEPDKFFTGTPSHIGAVPPGKNAVVGTFEILCVDPFKYSLVEYEAEPSLEDSSVLVDYAGTYKAFPTLVAEFYNEDEASEDGETAKELTGNGDCGYVAFFNESEKIIQLGDPEEVDGENAYAKSQTLVNSTFKTKNAWGSAAKSQWTVNNGIVSSSALEQTGAVGMGAASYSTTAAVKNTSSTLLKVQSDSSDPVFDYTVVCKSSNRAANSVKINVSISAALTRDSSYFGRSYGLKASLYIGGSWRTAVLKTTDEYWSGRTAHTKNLSFTVSGLSNTTTALTGIKFKVERTDSTGGTAGKLAEKSCKNMPISAYSTAQPETYYLTSTDYGSGANWHGGSITRRIPADAAGEAGAKNFTLSYSQKMSIGSGSAAQSELGAFQVLLASGSGSSRKLVAGVNIYKGSKGKKAKLRFYINGSVALTTNIDLSYNNKYFNSDKSSVITKVGDTVTFNICGIKKVFTAEEITDVAVNEVTITMSKFGTKTPLSFNGLYWVKFVKNNCDTWKDIPNKFGTGDIIEADCKTGNIYFNGVRSPEYGALGNDWEGFYLTPGLNQIGFAFSDWVEEGFEPKCKIRYREVFL